MLNTTNLLDLYALHVHTFILTDERLYFSQLDAESAQLHLVVDTTHVFQVAIAVVAHQIASMIYLDLFAVNHDVREFLCRQVLAFPIASSHLRTSHTQLTCHTQRQQVPGSIYHVGSQIVERTSNGDILVFAIFFQFEESSIDRKLSGSVCIDQATAAIWIGRHLLTTHHEVVDRQVWIHLQQQLSQLCGVATACDSVLQNKVVQQFHILAGFLWNGI